MLYRPGSLEELEIIGPAAQRPSARPRAVEASLDRLAALVEAFEPSSALVAVPAREPDAVAPVDAVKPNYSAEQLARLDQASFRAVSAAYWAGVHGHLAGGSPYARGGYGPLQPEDSGGAA